MKKIIHAENHDWQIKLKNQISTNFYRPATFVCLTYILIIKMEMNSFKIVIDGLVFLCFYIVFIYEKLSIHFYFKLINLHFRYLDDKL